MAGALAVPPLTADDASIVLAWETTWKTTPFQTFKYKAGENSPYANLPGGNCFDFAQAFMRHSVGAAPRIVSPRLLCYGDLDPAKKPFSHGNIAFQNPAHPDRLYTVDSGFSAPIRMPAAHDEVLSYKTVKPAAQQTALPPVVRIGPATLEAEKLAESVFVHTFDAAQGKWATVHFPKRKKGLPMVDTSQTNASTLARNNANGQSAALFLARNMTGQAGHGVARWGVQVTIYFGKGSGGRKRGDILFVFPGAPQEDNTLFNIYESDPMLVMAAVEKLASYLETDEVVASGQWDRQVSDCFDMLVMRLQEMGPE